MRRALAGRWRARGATATALAVVAAATLGTTGCGAVGPDDANAATAGKEAGDNALQPGVLPPNDPPQPGDARLGPDGHYDYSAPDFVLKNPCDTDAYGVALEKGWEPPVIGKQFKNLGQIQHCGIIKDGTGISIHSLSLNHEELRELSIDLQFHKSRENTWYTAVIPGDFGSSCFAGAFGPRGGTGVGISMGAFSFYNSPKEACSFATQQYFELFRGNNAI